MINSTNQDLLLWLSWYLCMKPQFNITVAYVDLNTKTLKNSFLLNSKVLKGTSKSWYRYEKYIKVIRVSTYVHCTYISYSILYVLRYINAKVASEIPS